MNTKKVVAPLPNTSFDASGGGSVFRNLIHPAMLD
jgi:hypothetical protein